MQSHKTLLAALLLLPIAAHAQEDARDCAHSQPRDLQLDFNGIDTVVFDIGANTLDARASAGATGEVKGRACASGPDRLGRLKVTQEKSGSTLIVRALRDGKSDNGLDLDLNIFGNKIRSYGYLTLDASVPDSVMVQLKIGSGDAKLEGARAASADVGSGAVEVSRIAGRFTGKVGSGEISAQDVGSLHLLAVGSGDATIRRVRGASKVGSVGSGDLEVSATRGGLELGSLGSGDIELSDIGGDVVVGSIGSGDISVRGAAGNLAVSSVGSGDVGHRDIAGTVDLPRGH